MTWATAGQAKQFYQRFFPDSPEQAEQFAAMVAAGEEISMAKIQELMILAGEEADGPIRLLKGEEI